MAELGPNNIASILADLDLAEMDIDIPQVSEIGDFRDSQTLREFLERSLVVGQGSEADILLFEAGSLQNLCLKKVERSTERSAFSDGILSEFDRHQEAYKILEKFREQGVNVAKIPVPFLSLDDGDKKLLLMEFIRGKTLWRLVLEEIVNAHEESELGCRKDVLLSMGDELGEYVLRIFNINPKLSQIDQVKALLRRLRGNKFIKPEFFEAMENSVRILNRAGFYHRDLHPSNVMLTDDSIWIIDFGYSKYDPKKSEDDPYEEFKFGTNLSFSRDEGLLAFLEPFVDKTREQLDEEREARLGQEYRRMNRVIDRMVSRQKSTVQDILDSLDPAVVEARDFVNQLVNDEVIAEELKRALWTTDLDKILFYANMAALLEYEQYGTTEASKEYFRRLIEDMHGDPAIALNRLRQLIENINPSGDYGE